MYEPSDSADRACEGTWLEAAALGESEPYLYVMRCSGCAELLVFSDFHPSLPSQYHATHEPGTTHEQVMRAFVAWVHDVRS